MKKQRLLVGLIGILVVALFAAPSSAIVVVSGVEAEVCIGDTCYVSDLNIFPDEVFNWEDVYANPHLFFDWESGSLEVIGHNVVDYADTIDMGLLSYTLSVKADPVVNLGFAVTAGNYNTTYTIQSAVLNISPGMTNPLAKASAAITLTDTGTNGATITGHFANNKTYRANYNYGPWVDLVTGTSVTNSSTIASERHPASGYTTISDTVSSMSSEFNFDLTANDQASGTSSFEIIPEPCTMALLSLGALALLRRKKR